MKKQRIVFDRRLFISLFSFGVYAAIFALMTYMPGKGMAIAAIIPIVIIAWLYGLWAGICAGLLSPPVNILMCMLFGLDWVEKFYVGGVGIAGTLIEILIGAVVGKLHDYNKLVQDELGIRKALEAELQQHRTRLEELVQFKTAELEASNRQLQASQLDMRQARDYLENLFRASPDAIFVTDADGYIVMANESVYDVYGYRPDEMIGQHAAILTSDDEKAWRESVVLIEKVFEQGLVRNWVADRQRKEGRVIQIETSVVLLKNPDGTPWGAISSSRDITDRKRLEEQVRQSQKMEAIGTLAGGIAHDFNNILGAIIGYTELSKDLSEGNSDLERNLSQVLKAADRAKNLVQQILAFSRKSESELKSLQLHLVVKEALNLLRSSIPTTIDIKTDIAAANDVAIADATQVHQIVMNLCANAAQAMQQKGGVLAVTLKAVDLDNHSVRAYADIESGHYVRLSVRDTGEGIPRHIINRIFEPFFTTKAVGAGTGMGLAVVHGIVKSLKGDIKVYSEPGKGTVFHVLLPRVPEEGVDRDVVPRSAPRGHERVLLVDDEAVLLEVGGKILSSLGYRVTATGSAVEAFEMFKKNPEGFDVVITDQTMPGFTGYELAQRLMGIRADIPVILCTGYSDLVTGESALAGGIKAFVSKPLNRLSIAETIRKVMGTSAA
jgi:PAS domain S-box-containing protein